MPKVLQEYLKIKVTLTPATHEVIEISYFSICLIPKEGDWGNGQQYYFVVAPLYNALQRPQCQVHHPE